MEAKEDSIIDIMYERDLGEIDVESDITFKNRALLYLYFNSENLTYRYIYNLKKYILRIMHLFRKSFIISVVFSEEVLSNYDLKNNIKIVQKLMSTLYNMFEPEHSKQFPMLIVAIIFPQVFETPEFPEDIRFEAFYCDSEVLSIENFDKIWKENFIEWKWINDIQSLKEIDLESEDIFIYDLDQPLISTDDTIDNDPQDGSIEDNNEKPLSKAWFKMTCMGGTFDHLHLGHKLLLSNACFYTSETIIIGITSEKMLSKKKCAYFLEDFEMRKTRVKAFVHLLTNGKVEARIFELNDPAGPGGVIKEIEAWILTSEVASGGAFLNNTREQNGLPKLQFVIVDMILASKEETGEAKFSNKTSSSYIREYLDQKTGNKGKELWDRFFELWRKIKIPEEYRLKWWSIIRDSYCTHWRYYFNLYHIFKILCNFDKYFNEDIYPSEYKIILEVAIWFHRIVFIPLDIDLTYNVDQSYLIAEKFIKESNYSVITLENVEFIKNLIQSVFRHRQRIEYENNSLDQLNKLFLDIIIAFLGTDKEEYAKYSENVRNDYLWVEEKEFKAKRCIILRRLLDRERIFITNKWFEAFEEKARINIKFEIENS